MKKDIKPLHRSLSSLLANQIKDHKADVQKDSKSLAYDDSSAIWMLRQLRPVSYSFKKGAESKYMRFGFLADELETVVPQVVRTVPGQTYADEKTVIYQDLIALLTAAAQGQQRIVETQQHRMEQLMKNFNELASELEGLTEDLSDDREDELKSKKPKKRKKSLKSILTNTTALRPPNESNVLK